MNIIEEIGDLIDGIVGDKRYSYDKADEVANLFADRLEKIKPQAGAQSGLTEYGKGFMDAKGMIDQLIDELREGDNK